jgi:predicted phage baseplate assembly protein
MTLANVTHSMTFGHTTLTFARELAYRYKRATVTLSANVAAATHGETRREVLGSGDASIPFQRFVLRQKPLTYVSAPVPSGGESTLALRVGGILWHESPDLYRLAPDERGYALRLDDEGYTRAIFGDGIHGARLPTGIENVTGIYRIGIGVGGLLGPLRITLLPSPPLGVRSVTNPVATSGAEDPETRDQARENAPITVRTMERIVSLRDFEDFAATFSGIGKARADRIWDGARRLIFVTVSDAIGEEVEEEAELLVNLEEAMNRARDPFQPMAIGSYQRVLFTLEARLKIYPDYESEVVEAAVEKTLRASFSFTARRFGQSVHRSEVVALIQGVEGVEAVDIEALDFVPPGPGGLGLEDRLDGLPARLGLDSDGNPVVIGAQLVTLSPASIVLEEIP